MTTSWHEEKRLFLQALELTIAEQASFVIRRAAHPKDAQRVLELLKHHNRDDSFLDSPVALEPTVLGGIRDAIDGFTIDAIIGRGSMGTVYRALQQQPRRTVAIKLMRNDFRVDEASLARFKNEAELLAKLKHPGIAHVYQSGTVKIDQERKPWFAMELITGGTLGEYLNRADLSLEDKLELVEQIVRAVAYAHQQHVIHRDLKPANILIQLSPAKDLAGDQPTIKIVDFGIARLNQENVASQLTRTHDILGTLNYMSPERLTRDVEADHRCDIYALGVVAFEILTGQLPFDRTYESLATTIKQLEFESPKRLTEVDASLPADLEVIVAKAMAPDPRVRYDSAEALLLDIQRFERGQPIRARRPTWAYRLSRYLKRNQILITASSITIIALLIGMVATWISAQQAHDAADASRYEADKANEVNSFFTNDLLGQLFHSGMDQDTLEAAKRSTDTIETQVDSMYADRPLIKAAIRNELGSIYYSFQAFEDAQRQFRLARELWESQLGLKHPDTLKAMSNLGQAQLALGATDETEELLRQAYQLRREVLGEAKKPTLHSLNNYAEFLRINKRLDEAVELFTRGLEIQRRSLGEADKVTLTTAANLGSLYLSQDNVEEALDLHKKSHLAARQTYGLQHSLALQTGVRWVQSLDRAERYGEAEREMRALVEVYEHQQGSRTRLITPYRLLARIYRHQKKFQAAMLRLEQALEIAIDADDARSIQRIERDINRVRQEQR